MTTALLIMGGSAGLFLAWVALVSHREGERTARRRATIGGVGVLLVYGAAAWLPLPGASVLRALLLVLPPALTLVLLWPWQGPSITPPGHPTARVDERTIMFSRAQYRPGTERFDAYYREFPEHREADDHFRTLAGLLSPRAGKHEPVSFAAADALFRSVEELADLVEGPVADTRHDLDPAVATAFVKGWARKLGAVDCRITTLQPHHLYTVKGRGPRYGDPVVLDHRFAVAFTVEMDHRALAACPEGPTIMESAQQYFRSGAIAVQLATWCRNMGWPAEAHIDANYKVVCPLVARDAGLGEIGRMGLLMTPRLGPRVRLAVVTTDLPLLVDPPRPAPDVLHFCRICRKCADNCPPRAIPAGEPLSIQGIKRWRIDQEACYTYWCATGTDCGKCLQVCPYSHPDSPLHNLVRRGLARSFLFRHFALRMDDLLYGRRPAMAPPPDWIPARQTGPRRKTESSTTT